MKICGIVSEYNPFHYGHLYQITETRKILGEQTLIVCVMSGNYVQRGDLAIYEKYERAKAAVLCGADLVLEIPLCACLSSAEGFALGSVALLSSLGLITHLSFGSECGEIDKLLKAASLPQNENVQKKLKKYLESGESFASSMQKAVSIFDKECAKLLSSPNNTLGIAYISALQRLKSDIIPITVTRKGAAHDSDDTLENMPSASFLRKITKETNIHSCRQYMPDKSFSVFKNAIKNGNAPVFIDSLDTAIISHLRRLSVCELEKYAGGSDGLAFRLMDSIKNNTSLSEICASAQTRRYPLARIRRSLLRAWLDLPYNMSVMPEYAKVLAAGKNGRQILKTMKKTCNLPIIIKPSAAINDDNIKTALLKDFLADDLYFLAMNEKCLHISGNSLRQTPFIEK